MNLDLDNPDDCFLVIMGVFLGVLLLAVIVIATLSLFGVFDAEHNGQHCVTKQLVHHAKVGNEWDCTKWVKN